MFYFFYILNLWNLIFYTYITPQFELDHILNPQWHMSFSFNQSEHSMEGESIMCLWIKLLAVTTICAIVCPKWAPKNSSGVKVSYFAEHCKWLRLVLPWGHPLQLSSACQHFHFQTCQEWFGGIVTNLPRLSKLQTLLLSVQGDSGVL